MRIFKLTFLLLTILVILSAVDVGECGKFINGVKTVGGKIGGAIKTVVKGVVKFEKAIDKFGGEIVPKVLDKLTKH
ncbi:unnamed protein product [Cylicocyclus nassatus]|uniref:Uncharacterized protein n=1 Tax=Cylicocyclus nassatus TaxID=53992 RepID=A0AA36LZS3_CYLNA|nr:unnamed protein product [Cylicocyclus nassatus]